jgi:enoyl-CoA hydratase/carnithine racemase
MSVMPPEATNLSDAPVITARAGGVLRITLNNPPADALSLSVMEALQEAFDAAAADEAVRVIVLAAVPGKVFCAGHDLKEMTARRGDEDGGKAFYDLTFATCARLMQSIATHRCPVIAEIDGIATAAGCQLVASCDLAIATDRSVFGVNGINAGLFCSTPAVALSRKIGRNHAMEMLLTGEMIEATSAREYGLVNRVVPEEYLNQIVSKYAQTIAAKSSFAIEIGKRTFNEQVEESLARAYETATHAIVENMMHDDAREGIAAFLERRKPEANSK